MALRKERQTSKLVKAEKAGGHNVEVQKVTQADLKIDRLPGTNYRTPIGEAKHDMVTQNVIHDMEDTIMFDPRPGKEAKDGYPISQSDLVIKRAAPRMSLHFDPGKTVVGIVTCGGLCPGLNDVVRGLTLTSINSYHVKRVIGFRYGYWGLTKEARDSVLDLTPDYVRHIQRSGGTVLGSSRGGRNIGEMVESLQYHGCNILFAVGGDGTQRGALAISKEVQRRGLDIAVVGIPKTIDNDLSFSHRTFGFETAVEQAVTAIRAAHAEASSHEYGIGVVKLMGRESGFIAAQACVSSAVANICLIPEKPTSKEEVIHLVKRRFASSKSCIIVVAEGFGQDWPECNASAGGKDASGNKKLADIGHVVYGLMNKLHKSDKRYAISTVKYIDPSYMIRACVPSASDSAFCVSLSTLAVHEAMAGCTGCVITQWYSNFVLVPIALATSLRKIVALNGTLWRLVQEVTVSPDGSYDPTLTNAEMELASLEQKHKHLSKVILKLKSNA